MHPLVFLPLLFAATPAQPSITLTYTAQETLAASTGAAPIAPGRYQLIIVDNASDTSEPVHMFHLSGPGVNIETDLQGGDDKSELYAVTLAPNATYTFADDDEPRLPAVVFRTSDAAPVTVATTTTTAVLSGRSSNTAVVGSANKVTVLGTLTTTIAPSGALVVKHPGTLKPGHYKIVVGDRSTSAGLSISQGRAFARALTTRGFTGTRSITVELWRGVWQFSSGGHEQKLVVS